MVGLIFLKLRKQARPFARDTLFEAGISAAGGTAGPALGLSQCRECRKDRRMEEFSHRRGRPGLAMALLAAAAILPLRVGPGRAEGASIDPAPSGVSDQALAPRAGSSTPEPVRVFTDTRGRTCSVYERRVMIEGAPSTALATICRELSGRWVLSR
jgi:hypothetical protein